MVAAHRPFRSTVGLIVVLALSGCASPTVVPMTPVGLMTAAPSLAPAPAPVASAVTVATAPACDTTGQTWVSPADRATLVCVPAGTFQMGTAPGDPAATAVSQPRHEVHLSAYWIDRTEVTNADYERCVTASQCRSRPKLPGSTGVASKTVSDYYHDPVYADYPVLIYTPEEAIAYCTCMGRRLPTEAEWEYAAAGSDGRRYPWGDTLDCDHASYFDCTTDTTPVDVPLAGASPYGALNLAGNVAEWVNDFWAEGYDATSTVVDPTGPATGTVRVRRGGGMASLARDLAVTARLSGEAAHYFDGQMGFRCAASAASAGGVTPTP